MFPSIGDCIPGESALNSGVGRGIDSAAETSSVPGVAAGALIALSFAEMASALISAGDIPATAAGDDIDDNSGLAAVVTVVEVAVVAAGVVVAAVVVAGVVTDVVSGVVAAAEVVVTAVLE